MKKMKEIYRKWIDFRHNVLTRGQRIQFDLMIAIPAIITLVILFLAIGAIMIGENNLFTSLVPKNIFQSYQ